MKINSKTLTYKITCTRVAVKYNVNIQYIQLHYLKKKYVKTFLFQNKQLIILIINK